MPEGLDAGDGAQELREGLRQGPAQDLREDGHLDAAELPRRADLRGGRPRPRARRALLHGHAPRASRAWATTCSRARRRCATQRAFPGEAWTYPELDPGGLYQWRARGERHTFNPDTVAKLQHAVRAPSGAATRTTRSSAARPTTTPSGSARCAGCSASAIAERPIPLEEVEPASADREALLHRRDVLRLDLARGPPDARRRDEPPRRQEQHRRGRRGPGALQARAERRPAPQRDQAGGLGPLRRDELVPGQRRRAADQDRPGREARRGRRAARPQGRTRRSRGCATRRRASA